MEGLKLAAVLAHPDDESMGMGGVLAKYAAQGVETYLVCATRGERGWCGPEESNPGPEAVGRGRTAELECAVRELGMSGLHFLGYVDGEVDRAQPEEIIGRIASHLRRIRPQVVVTFPPDGNYGHPDHIAVGQFTHAGVVCAADSTCTDPHGLEPHRVSKLYYLVDSERFISTIAPFMGDLTFRVGDQTRHEVPWPEWMITTRIEMAAYCRTAWRAIRCHQSQLPSLGRMAELEEEAALTLLSMQGTFYRAFSLVNSGREVEADLFEGVRES